MKNWKKGLACLLAGVMMLAMLTACNGIGGQTIGLKHSTEADAADLCAKLNVNYDKDLSDDAYIIANWIASYPTSCRVTSTEIEREGNANFVTKTYLQQERYASALLEMGIYVVANDFVPGFDIDCDLDTTDTNISFTIPVEGRVPSYMSGAAKGKTKMGVAYVVAGDKKYVVAVFA